MQTKKLVVVGLASVGVLVVAGAGAVAAVQIKEGQSQTLSSISEQCNASIDDDGFGHAKIKSGHIQNQNIKMDTPCVWELNEGSTLQLTKVTMETANLYITAEANAKKAVHIVVKDSVLKSVIGGIYVQVPVSGSSVDVMASQFNYPLSVGISVGTGDDDAGAILRVSKNSFVSKSKDSEGILLVSTGQAFFNDNQFKVGNPDEDALLVAPKCQSSNNGDAIVHCQ